MKLTTEQFSRIFPFKEPRQYQKEIIEKIISAYLEKNFKYVICNLPTGIGKSIIAYSVSSYFKNYINNDKINKTYFLTSQKVLQKQYIDDFKDSTDSIKTVYGKANYTCIQKTNLSCENGPCLNDKIKYKECLKTLCPYVLKRNEAYMFPLTILNYSYFFNMAKLKGDKIIQKPRQLLVLDECHNLEQELINYITIKISKYELNQLELKNLFRFPSEDTSDDSKLEWLFKIVTEKVMLKINMLISENNNYDENSKESQLLITKINYLSDLIDKIEILEKINKLCPCIVLQNKNFEIKFKPLFCSDFSKDYLFNFSEKVLLMSATVISKKQLCQDLGIEEKEVFYIECESTFKKKNRPIYSLNLVNMNYKNKEKSLPKITKIIDKILISNKNKRGIIHTVNYNISDYVKEHSKFKNRLILPKGKSRESELNYFFSSNLDNLILLSPSLMEGISLNGKLSEFSIICKIPFGNMGDKWIKQRMNFDPKWYNINTVKSIIQCTGRTIRSKNDIAKTYILDSSFNWFFKQNKHLFPKWWKDSIIFPN